MPLAPIPAVRNRVEVAKRFVAGEVHFSHMVAPTEACLLWAKVHGADPAIQALAPRWQLLADRAWNEFGQHGTALSVEDSEPSSALGCGG